MELPPLPEHAPVPVNGRPTTADFLNLVEFTWRINREAHAETMAAFASFEAKFDARMERIERASRFGVAASGMASALARNWRPVVLLIAALLVAVGIIDDIPAILRGV